MLRESTQHDWFSTLAEIKNLTYKLENDHVLHIVQWRYLVCQRGEANFWPTSYKLLIYVYVNYPLCSFSRKCSVIPTSCLFQWLDQCPLVVDFMICLNESVCIRQFAKKSRSNRLFVLSFSRVSGSGESRFSVTESVRLSSSLVLILKRITILQWCKRSSINTTLTKFLLAEERFMFGIGMLLPGWLSWLLSPRVFTTKHSQWSQHDSATGAGSRISENKRYKRDKLKRGIRSVCSR